jgi:hypothetical protein
MKNFSNRLAWQHQQTAKPLDIAAVIAKEMEKPFEGRTIRYIASDEISPNDTAKISGEAIVNPDLQWIQISDEQMLKGLLAAGM